VDRESMHQPLRRAPPSSTAGGIAHVRNTSTPPAKRAETCTRQRFPINPGCATSTSDDATRNCLVPSPVRFRGTLGVGS
jgi:hypothetical protein